MALPPLAGDHQNNNDEEYTVEVVDVPQHTPGHMCWDPTCPCHDDQEIIGGINQHVQDGLLTPDNATDIVKGKNIWHLQRLGLSLQRGGTSSYVSTTPGHPHTAYYQ